ncbi:hypothetical protein D3C73_1599280 [compost metagenome]
MQEVDQRLSRFFLEEGADVIFPHHDVPRQRLERNVLVVVLFYILNDFVHFGMRDFLQRLNGPAGQTVLPRRR